MNPLLQNLIEALREELKQYGEMLALLDQQQQQVILRHAQDLLQTVASVDAQAEAVRVARQEREQRRRRLARAFGLDDEIAFRELTPHLPADYRPLVQALVQENNELLLRVQQRARQNHLLLSRAVELMQRFINTLVPGAVPSTYSEAGLVPAAPLAEHSLYNALG